MGDEEIKEVYVLQSGHGIEGVFVDLKASRDRETALSKMAAYRGEAFLTTKYPLWST